MRPPLRLLVERDLLTPDDRETSRKTRRIERHPIVGAAMTRKQLVVVAGARPARISTVIVYQFCGADFLGGRVAA